MENTNIFDRLTRYGFGERGNLPGLAGLRVAGLAVVLLAHLSGSRGFIDSPRFYSCGMFAMRLFFVVSGFLITSILLRDLQKNGQIRLGRFYFRRAMRVFPAAYFFIAVMAVLAVFGLVQFEHGDLLSASTYTMNFRGFPAHALGHLWTLAIEEQFYLFWPAALMILGWKRGMRSLIGLVLVAPLIRVVIPDLMGPRFALLWDDHSLLFWSDALATGCLLSMLWRDLNRDERFSRLLSSRWF